MRTMGRGWIYLVLWVWFMVTLSIAGEKTETPLDREARVQVEQFFGRQLTKCGEDYYRRYSVNTREHFDQFHGGIIQVQPSALTPADRLNGIEWRGWAAFNTEAQRVHRGIPNRTWEEWTPRRGILIELEKQREQWTIHPGLFLSTHPLRVDCTKLPK